MTHTHKSRLVHGLAITLLLAACNPAGSTMPPESSPSLSAEGQMEAGDTPTIVPTQGTAQFSVPSATADVPSDVLKEIIYFSDGIGGGGGCGDYQGPPFIQFEGRMGTTDAYEIADTVSSTECGFQVGEIITLTLTFPDGRTVVQTGVYPDNVFSYALDLDDPTGRYQAVVSGGQSGSASAAFEVNPPDGPRFRIRCLEEMDYADPRPTDADFTLYNFEPNEPIRLFAYRVKQRTAELVGWRSYQLDARGRLLIKADKACYVQEPDGPLDFVVLGETSGLVTQVDALGGFTTIGSQGVNTLSASTTPGEPPPDIHREIPLLDEFNPRLECPDASQPTFVGFDSGQIGATVLRTGDNVSVYSCGWQPDESVKMRVVFPDGSIDPFPFDLSASSTDDLLALRASIPLTMTSGAVQFEWLGSLSGSLSKSLDVYGPDAPALIVDDTNQEIAGTKLHLVKFAPGERIQVFAYSRDSFDASLPGQLVAWNTLTVDERGELVVTTILDQYGQQAFAVIGEVSGEVVPFNRHDAFGGASISTGITATKSVVQLLCFPGAGTRANVYSEPTEDASLLAEVRLGALMTPLEVRERSGELWWRVKLNDGAEGWIADQNVRRLRAW